MQLPSSPGAAARSWWAEAERRAIFALVCGLGAAWSLAYFTATRLVSPSGTSGTILGDIVYPLAEATAGAMLVWAGRRASGATRRFFWWMALSTAMGLCGDVTWALLVIVEHEPPSPSVADVTYLASIAAIFPALYAQFGSPLRRSRDLLDSSMVVLLLAYVAISMVLRPQLAGGLTRAALVPVIESVLLLMAGVWAIVVALTAPVRPPLGVRLVSVGIVIQATSWLVYAYAVTVRGVADGSWIYTGWQISWAVMIAGAAATLLLRSRDAVRTRLMSSSPWVATAGLLALIGAIFVHSDVLRSSPGEVIVAALGLVILLGRLHLTVRDRGRLATQMHSLAETDALTGIPNRRAFERRLQQAAADTLAGGAPVGILVIDVDRFKMVNDGYGHPVGDEVLRQVTARVAASLRPTDTLARIGGEEFGVIAPGTTADSLPDLAERCHNAVSAYPIVVEGATIPVTLSVGGACMPGHAVHVDELMRVADRALYEAKDAGRNQVHVGGESAPQREIPIPETGVVAQLEALADRLDGEQAQQEHSLAMVDVTHRLCRSLGVSVAERRRCLAAARLHDIGKVGTPGHILRKPGPLTPAEKAVMQDHVRVGAELLAALPETCELAPIVAQHHEHFNGDGYPAGLAGDLIAIEARIIAVADAWTAMLADRPYRAALTLAAARTQLVEGVGTQFDPRVVGALLALIDGGALEADPERRAA
jgi:two-component system, cell cycle response regulator